MANSSFLREYFALHNVPVYLETKLAEVKDDGIVAIDKDGRSFDIKADNVIVSIGYNPLPLEVKGKNIHLVGDCNGVGNLRTVIWRAWDVAMKL